MPKLFAMAMRACRLAALCLAATGGLLAAAARADNITVTHWGGQFYGVPYAVAMDKGFFKAHGADVTGILTAPGGGTAVRNTLAGGIPFGEVSLAAAVQAINAGEKLIIVAAGTQSVADQMWAVKKGSPLHGLKDLAGKRIGYTAPGSVSNMIILMALKANGMTAQQVHLVPAGDLGANLSAVTTGALDAGFSDSLFYAQNPTLIEPVFWVKDVMSPRMMQTVCITTVEFAHAHPDIVRGIIAARREGLDYLRQHTDEAADITARAYNNPDVKLFREHMKELAGLDYWSDGKFDYDGMNHMVEGLQITGQLKAAPDWSKMVDTSFLPADQRAAR
ncbi:MAG: ABC transporter substrate-binding protein [Acidisphaera sp.]|nr:ABC transporter substrate-binding protein [Acidisphaera sp.]